MKNVFLKALALAILVSCGGVRKTQEALNTGNFGQAIDKSIRELAGNKTRRSNQPYVLLLEDAYGKFVASELREINFLEKEGNPANLENIYRKYTGLKEVQNRIRPLLPLPVYEENREAHFAFREYDRDILSVKEDLSAYLYENASHLLEQATRKDEFRKAFEDFRYLNEINPGYADTREQMDRAYRNGLDYVRVELINDTRQVIPERLEADLLNFNTYRN